MNNVEAKKRLEHLIGTALANKLETETTDTHEVILSDISALLIRAKETRSSLIADELSQYSPEVRAEALLIMSDHHSDVVSCVATEVSAILALSAGEQMSQFIYHCAKHYETEISRRVFEPFQRAAEAKRDEHLHQAAAKNGPCN